MAGLKLTSIAVSKEQENSLKKNYLYKDIRLDLTSDIYLRRAVNQTVPLRDVQAIYDIEAVKTSIANCFLTSPGQRVLSPEYGIDLRRYIFESVNDNLSYFIRDDISRLLPIFEPRIVLRDVSVIADTDNQQYDITLQLDVPSLRLTGVTVKNYLKTTGYY